MAIDNDKINEIRNNANIADIIANYIPINKKGKNYVALCPFHNDHSPSLSINQDKQIYKCFVCGNGGNVFTFVQNYEHLNFLEAVKKVADLSHQNFDYENKVLPKIANVNEKYFKITEAATLYCNYMLKTPNGKKALNYLESRQIDNSIIDMFDIGFNPSNDDLYKYLKAKNYDDDDLIALNLCQITDYGIKDVFSNRIIFPISDKYGNNIAYSARTIDNDERKYINTSETKFYHKGNTLYNYHRCKDEAKKQQKLIVTEGVMDTIAFARANIYNVCATLGTATTLNQLKLMKEISNKVVLCYDGDIAGQNATYKVGKMAITHNISISVLENKSQLDPDEIINKYGKEGILDLLSHEVPWIQFLISYLQIKYDINDYNERKSFVLEMQEEINKLQDDFDKQNLKHQIALMTGINIEIYNQKSKLVNEYISKDINLNNGLLQAEYIILAQMISSIKAVEIYKEELGYLIDEQCNHLALTIIDEYRKYNCVNISKLVDSLSDNTQKDIILNISTSEIYIDKFDNEVLSGAIITIKMKLLEQKAELIKKQLKEIQNSESRKILMNEYNQVLLERRRLIDGQSKETTNR